MSEVKIYERPKTWMPDVSSHYCPGCGHGIAHRLVCEVIDELGIQNHSIGVAPVGCAAKIYDYIDTGFCEASTPTRATATLPLSAWERSSTRQTGARTLRSSSSTMQFME